MMWLFYVPLVPLISVVWIFGIIYQYWIEKYLLLRRYKIPEQMGRHIASYFIKIIPFCMFLIALGQFIFISRLSGGENNIVQIPLWFTLWYLILPFSLIFKTCNSYSQYSNSPAIYEKHYKEFKTDYNKANPVSFNIEDNCGDRELERRRSIRRMTANSQNSHGINSDNININSLMNYCKMGTLNERVHNMYQNTNIFIRNDSNVVDNYRHLVDNTIKFHILNIRNARALDNLK